MQEEVDRRRRAQEDEERRRRLYEEEKEQEQNRIMTQANEEEQQQIHVGQRRTPFDPCSDMTDIRVGCGGSDAIESITGCWDLTLALAAGELARLNRIWVA